jgi:hypothetical protein
MSEPHKSTMSDPQKSRFATLPLKQDPFEFTFPLFSRDHLAVAEENYKASRPAIRAFNLTVEVMKMVRTSRLKRALSLQLSH